MPVERVGETTPVMALRPIDRQGNPDPRRIEPAEERGLRAIKAGDETGDAQAVCRNLLDYARRRKLWIACDCLGPGAEAPVIVPRLKGGGRYALVNRPFARTLHAEDCVFRRGELKPAGAGALHSDIVDPAAAMDADPGEGRDPDAAVGPSFPGSPSAGASDPRVTMSSILGRLVRRARLNRLAEADAHASPEGWLPEIARAAETFRAASEDPLSEFLFTDPASWRSGAVARRLEEAEPDWPGRGGPTALLCWAARDLAEHEIERGRAGHVRVRRPIAFPRLPSLEPVRGPWLFLGAVARAAAGQAWECLAACAWPIVGTDCPIPVDSHYERRALGSLRRLVRGLETDPALGAALGGTVRVELEKPLAAIEVTGGPCLPDFLLTVARPDAYGHLPGGPGQARHRGRFDPRDRARYVIEVMGSGDAEYEEKKKVTHARMRRIGPVFRMEGGQFGSRGNPLRRQRERIAAAIANDIERRWKTR